MSVVANVPLSLQCVAHGPPEPVRVIWLQDGAPLNTLSDPIALSPSTLNITGTLHSPQHRTTRTKPPKPPVCGSTIRFVALKSSKIG